MMTFKVEDIVTSDDQNMIFDERKLILRAQKFFDGGSEIMTKQGLLSILKTWPVAARKKYAHEMKMVIYGRKERGMSLISD